MLVDDGLPVAGADHGGERGRARPDCSASVPASTVTNCPTRRPVVLPFTANWTGMAWLRSARPAPWYTRDRVRPSAKRAVAFSAGVRASKLKASTQSRVGSTIWNTMRPGRRHLARHCGRLRDQRRRRVPPGPPAAGVSLSSAVRRSCRPFNSDKASSSWVWATAPVMASLLVALDPAAQRRRSVGRARPGADACRRRRWPAPAV